MHNMGETSKSAIVSENRKETPKITKFFPLSPPREISTSTTSPKNEDRDSSSGGSDKNATPLPSSDATVDTQVKDRNEKSSPTSSPRITRNKTDTEDDSTRHDKKETDSTNQKAKKSKGRKKSSKPKQKNDKEFKVNSPLPKRLTDYFTVRRSNRKCKSVIEAEQKQSLEDAILTGKEEGLEVKDIAGKGRGVVSTRPFKRGDFVVEYHGDHIDIETAKEREAEYSRDPSIGCYMYYFEYKNKKYCVDATKESGRLGRLLNHSKNGNCCTRMVSVKDKPYLILVAQRDIKKGEELVYDYGDRNKDTIEHHPWLAL